MDMIPFSIEVKKGRPILIITPYSVNLSDHINIIAISLLRAGLNNIYIDKYYSNLDVIIPIYHGGDGIIIISSIPENFTYNDNIIPIYVVEWGIRNFMLKEFQEWISPSQYEIFYAGYLQQTPPPTIITHYYNLNSDKLSILLENIISPCIIYTYDDLISNTNIIRNLGYPIYSSDNSRELKQFLHTKTGIIISKNISILDDTLSQIPIHILHFDSSQNLDLVSKPRFNTMHIYITKDNYEYHLFIDAIKDCNNIYQQLIMNSFHITMDKYNNLYVNAH